jgi:hypothetical protein
LPALAYELPVRYLKVAWNLVAWLVFFCRYNLPDGTALQGVIDKTIIGAGKVCVTSWCANGRAGCFECCFSAC